MFILYVVDGAVHKMLELLSIVREHVVELEFEWYCDMVRGQSLLMLEVTNDGLLDISPFPRLQTVINEASQFDHWGLHNHLEISPALRYLQLHTPYNYRKFIHEEMRLAPDYPIYCFEELKVLVLTNVNPDLVPMIGHLVTRLPKLVALSIDVDD